MFADTDVIFRFSLQASRAKIGQGEMLVSRIWQPFLESISVFVLDVQVQKMDFSEKILLWICFLQI